MVSENEEVNYCEDDGEYRVYFNICDKLCIERFYRKINLNHKLIRIIFVKRRIKTMKSNCFFTKVFFISINLINHNYGLLLRYL